MRRGVQWLVGAVVAAGAVATAIAAITALWPSPTPELHGEIRGVSIDTNVALSEYRTRHEISAVAPTMTSTLHLVAVVPAQTTTEETTTGETTTEETTTTGETTTTEETTTGETTTEETTTTGETTTEETTTTERGAVRLSPAARAGVLEGVGRALDDPKVPQMGVGPACLGGVAPDCSGFASEHVYLGVFNEDGSLPEVVPDAFASRLARLLEGTRNGGSFVYGRSGASGCDGQLQGFAHWLSRPQGDRSLVAVQSGGRR
jgi:hypothetical protein